MSKEHEDTLDALKVLSKNTRQEYELIGENDTFEFQCQRCGACCMNREDIILNAWDVFQASKALGISCSDFVKKYTVQTLGGFSKLPLIYLGSKDNGMCHFLNFDYMNSGLYECTINSCKPGACASHPLGIMSRYDVDTGVLSDAQFIKVEQCHSSRKPVKQNVHDWMSHYLNHKDEFAAAHAFVGMYTTNHETFRKYYFLTMLCMSLAISHGDDPEKDVVVQAFGAACDMIIHYTYINYDTTKPFIEQAEANLKELDEFLTGNDEKVIRLTERVINDILKPQNITVQELIDKNDIEGGINLDIGKLAMILASRIHFSDDKKGGE